LEIKLTVIVNTQYNQPQQQHGSIQISKHSNDYDKRLESFAIFNSQDNNPSYNTVL
jgi:hypothetical protein